MHALSPRHARPQPFSAGQHHAVRPDRRSTSRGHDREAVRRVISLLDGTAQVVAKLLYGSGLRIMEAVRSGSRTSMFRMKPLTVRSGEGPTRPVHHLSCHAHPCAPASPGRSQDAASADSAQGHGRSTGPGLARILRNPAKARAAVGRPRRDISVDPVPVSTVASRGPRASNKAIKVAVRRAGLTKTSAAHTFRHAFATHLLQRGTNSAPFSNYSDTTMWPPPYDLHPHPAAGGQGVPSPLDDLGI